MSADPAPDPPWGSAEYQALVANGLRAPNQRAFNINDDYAWELFRPEPSALPPFPPSWAPKVERDDR